MSLIINRIKPLCCKSFSILDNLEYSQKGIFINFVRWRKRRWLPVNKSKIFYVHEKKRNVEEQAEFKKLTLLKAEVESETLDNKQSSGEMSYEMESLLKENDLWNIKSASIRESRQQEDRLKDKQSLVDSLSEFDLKLKQTLQDNEAMVLVQRELEKAFVDVEKLDEEIDAALSVKHTYNYVIDVQGNKYTEDKDGVLNAQQQQQQ